MVHNDIRIFGLQRVRSESVGYGDGPHAGIASGAHIDVRVADDDGLLRRNATLG
jgi:hypothetical protein